MSQICEVRARRTIKERVKKPVTKRQVLLYFEEEEEEGILGNEESIGLVGV